MKIQQLSLLWMTLITLVMSDGMTQAADLPKDKWKHGPHTVQMGTVAQIQLPQGFWSLNNQESIRTFCELSRNPYDSSILLIIVPDLHKTSEESFWFIECSYDPTGYVRDNEKDQLNGAVRDQILTTIRKQTEAANPQRRDQGWPTLDVDGWQMAPFYSSTTNNLTWSILARNSEGTRTANYNSRILGRSGVLRISLVLAPEQVTTVVPSYDRLITNIQFVPGQRYAEFRQGDRTAAYGLTALAAGGTSIIVAKNWKGVIGLGAAVLAILGGIGKWAKSRVNRSRPAVASAGGSPSAASDVTQCSVCGQQNRLREQDTGAICGRCGAKLS